MNMIRSGLLASVWLIAGITPRAFVGQVSSRPAEPVAGFAAAAEIPPGSAFDLPAQNACQSKYDQFYIAEPGVYAYWALCEQGSSPNIFDYAGIFDLSVKNHTWSSGPGTIHGGAPGPVPDGETADQAMTGAAFIANQNIPLNSNEGTLALWANTDATDHPMAMAYLGAVSGKSGVSIAAFVQPGGECFTGSFSNASGTPFTTPPACGYTVNQWHRIAFTWANGALTMYVDGADTSRATYSGRLEDKVFVYRLFPQSGNTGKQMTLAKVAVANRAWSAEQVAVDYKPKFLLPPKGGVQVTAEHLGAIHRDVLGYADCNEDLSAGAPVGPLTNGLASIGVTAIRYANGSAGITADLEDWSGGLSCTRNRGAKGPADNASTQNDLDSFVTKVARPLRASLGFTINYGTNPPQCDSGGDPVANGARPGCVCERKEALWDQILGNWQ